MEIVLALIALIGLPAMAIAGFIMALQARRAIAQQATRVNALALEVSRLRSAVTALGGGEPLSAEAPHLPERPLAGEAPPMASEPEKEPLPEPEMEPESLETPPQRPLEEELPLAAREQAPGLQEPPSARSARDLESMIGGRWSVLLGGFATALGAVLLVRVAIEAGLLGPAARVMLGAILSAGLLAGGEILRRRDRKLELPVFRHADVPAVLTAAGAVAAFATVFSAYSLYGFIGPATAFIALTIVGLVTLALSAVHGPWIAALGVVASYLTPALVSSQEPNFFALATHVLVVTASVLGIAALRGWLWLAFCAVAGATGWTVVSAFSFQVSAGLAGFAMLAGSGLLYWAAFGRYAHGEVEAPAEARLDRAAAIAFSALAFAFLAQAFFNPNLPVVLSGTAASIIVAISAVMWPSLAPISLVAAFIAVFAIAVLDLQIAFEPGLNTAEELWRGLVPLDTAAFLRNAAVIAAPATLALLWGAWRYATNAQRAAGWLASGAGATAMLALLVTYMRIAPFETHRPFGAAGLAMAFIFAVMVEAFTRRRPGDMSAPAPAALAVASVAALAYAFAVTLETGWLPLAFALASAGIAWVHGARPIAVLPVLALIAAVIGAANIWFSLPFDPVEIGTRPFFNQLVLLVGLPAIAIVAGGEYMRRNGSNLPAAGTIAVGLGLSALFVALEIRHWLSGGNIGLQSPELAETATNALAALGFAMGLQLVATRTGARIYSLATSAAGAISIAIIAAGLLIYNNPFFHEPVPPIASSLFFNVLLPGYLLPSIGAGLVALMSRGVRSRWYTLAFAALSGLLLFMWVTVTIRHHWMGSRTGVWWGASEPEVWTYSAAWLLLGVALLAAGHLLGSRATRAASGILIALTVTKVFLIDMSALTGAYRAFSFIGLGLSLLAIGRFYQHILRSGGSAPPSPPSAHPPTASGGGEAVSAG